MTTTRAAPRSTIGVAARRASTSKHSPSTARPGAARRRTMARRSTALPATRTTHSAARTARWGRNLRGPARTKGSSRRRRRLPTRARRRSRRRSARSLEVSAAARRGRAPPAATARPKVKACRATCATRSTPSAEAAAPPTSHGTASSAPPRARRHRHPMSSLARSSSSSTYAPATRRRRAAPLAPAPLPPPRTPLRRVCHLSCALCADRRRQCDDARRSREGGGREHRLWNGPHPSCGLSTRAENLRRSADGEPPLPQ